MSLLGVAQSVSFFAPEFPQLQFYRNNPVSCYRFKGFYKTDRESIIPLTERENVGQAEV